MVKVLVMEVQEMLRSNVSSICHELEGGTRKSKDGMGAKGLIGGGERAGTWRERRRQTDTGKRTRLTPMGQINRRHKNGFLGP